MKRSMKVFPIARGKVATYFLRHIGSGKSLSKAIHENLTTSLGEFFTVLPTESSLKNIFQFEYGGIVPSTPGDATHSGFVHTTDQECSELLYQILQSKDDYVLVVENVLMNSESPFSEIPNVKKIPLKSETYYLLDTSNSPKDIYTTLRKSNAMWHFLAILVHKNLFLDAWKSQLLQEVCSQAQLIIASAYDGEGYIFWTRASLHGEILLKDIQQFCSQMGQTSD